MATRAANWHASAVRVRHPLRRQHLVRAVVRRTHLEATKLGERAALLAYHWDEAGVALEAAKWHRRAAEWVLFYNPAEALQHWRRLQELWMHFPRRQRAWLRERGCAPES